MILTTIAVLLTADQVRTGGHYRREVLLANIERGMPASARVLAASSFATDQPHPPRGSLSIGSEGADFVTD